MAMPLSHASIAWRTSLGRLWSICEGVAFGEGFFSSCLSCLSCLSSFGLSALLVGVAAGLPVSFASPALALAASSSLRFFSSSSSFFFFSSSVVKPYHRHKGSQTLMQRQQSRKVNHLLVSACPCL